MGKGETDRKIGGPGHPPSTPNGKQWGGWNIHCCGADVSLTHWVALGQTGPPALSGRPYKEYVSCRGEQPAGGGGDGDEADQGRTGARSPRRSRALVGRIGLGQDTEAIITGLSASPTTVTTVSGQSTISALVSNATSCTVSATPALLAGAGSVGCSGGTVNQVVAFPNSSPNPKSGVIYKITLTATGPGGIRSKEVRVKGFVLSGAVVGLSPLGPTGAGAGSTWLESPVPSPSLYSDLQSVSCTSGSSCIAVGNQSDGSVEQTLVEAWDGTTWTVVPSPAPGPTSHLNSVVCTSASDCVAVGVTSSGAYQTLIEMWDGSAWSVAPSPNPSNVDVLNDVTCTDPSNCVAVGSQQTGAGPQALIEAWDGTTWTVVPSAATDAAIVLSGISCTSASDCVAVGLSASTANQPLIETWDGTNWAVTPSPSPDRGGRPEWRFMHK